VARIQSSPRDFQRSRVYRAEDAAWLDDEPLSLVDLQRRADVVVCSDWWLEDFGELEVFVRPGHGHRRGVAYTNSVYIGGYVEIQLPLVHRGYRSLLHELAHAATTLRHPGEVVASHGAEFCTYYLLIVRHAMDNAKADSLRESFVQHGVKYLATLPRRTWMVALLLSTDRRDWLRRKKSELLRD
jgi:hypothetical protein